MTDLRKGVINQVDSKEKKLQTAQVEGLRGELNDKVETYQNYGMTAHPMPCDPNGEGAEVIYANLGSSTMRTIIATDDRRYRPIKTKEGDVVLYSRHDAQKAEHTDSKHRIALTDDGTGKDYRILAKTNEAHLELKNDNSITVKNKKGSLVLDGEGNITKTAKKFKVTADENAIEGKTSITGDTVKVKGKTSIDGATKVSGDSFTVSAPSDGISFDGPSFKFNGHDVLTTENATSQTDDWNNTNPPSSSPTLGAISITPSVAGSNDATFNWSYTQGALKAESFTLFVNKGLTPPTANSEVFATLSAGYSSYRAVGLPQDQTYSIGIVANRNCIEGVKSTPIVTGWVINGGTVHVEIGATSLLDGTLVSDITSSMGNYNTSNDNNGSAIAAPTNVHISHVNNTNGSVDVTMTWDWSGTESDIDGFGILVHTGTTNAAYALGQSTDNVYTVFANKRSKTWYGVDSTKWYTAGVLAYRAVNKTISSNGLIVSACVASAVYQPNATPDLSITINGMSASSITSNIVNFNTLNDMDGSAVSAPSSVLVTHVMNTNGSADVTVSWVWSGNEADIDGFGIYTYTAGSNAAHTIDLVNDHVYPTLAKTRSRTFYGIDATKFYTVGLVAYRAVAKSVASSGFILSSCVQATVYQPNSSPSVTALINGIPASQITAGLANFNLLNDMNSAAISAPTSVNVTSTANSNGSYDVTLTWAWSGTNSDIDGFGIYVYAGTTNSAHAVNLSTDTVYITKSDARTYTWLGVDATKFYTVNLVAYRSVNTSVNNSGFIASSFVPYGPYQPNATPSISALINGVTASSITSAVANYNTSNDSNSAAISACTGLSLSKVDNSNGSCDVTLTWTWGGSNADIDGFGIYVYSAATNAAHGITTADVVYWSNPGTRTKTWYGVDSTKWYTVGIVAYRSVNHNVNNSGFITSAITQLSAYQPNAAPNVTALINGTSASTLTTNASNGNNAYNGTAAFRTSGAPTNAPVYSTIVVGSQSAAGLVDIQIIWTYTQGTVPADKFLIYVNADGTLTAPTTSSPMVAMVDANTRTYHFTGVAADKTYTAGVAAMRTAADGNYIGTITTGWSRVGTAATVQATTAPWTGVTGTGKPADNATVGAPSGTLVGTTSANTVETQANAGNNAANDTSTFRNTGTPSNQPTLGSVTTSAISAGGTVDITLTWTYTQGALPADGFIIYSAQGTTAPTIASPVGGIVGANDRSFTFRGVPADKDYRAGIVAYRNTPAGSTVPGQRQNAIVTGWSYTAQTVSLNAASLGGTTAATISTNINNAGTTAAWTGVTSKPSNIFTHGLGGYINGSFAYRDSWAYNAQGYPDKWSAWTNWTTDTPIKDTVLVRSGENSIGWDNIASISSNVGLVQNILCTVDKNTTISGSVDVYIKSLTGTNTPGIYIALYNTAGTFLGYKFFQSKNIVGSWQTINVNYPGDGVNDVGTVTIYVMGSYSVLTGQVNGSIRFANLQIRTQDGTVFDNRKQSASDIQGQLNGATQVLDASLTAVKTNIAAINASSGNIQAAQASVIQGFYGTLSAFNGNFGTITAGTADTTGYIRARGAVSVDGYNAAMVSNDSNTQHVGINARGTVNGGTFQGGTRGIYAFSSNGYGVMGDTNTGYAGYFYAQSSGNAVVANSTSGYSLYAYGNNYFANFSIGTTAQVAYLNASYLGGYTAAQFAQSSHSHPYYCIAAANQAGGTAYPDYGGTLYFASQVAGTAFSNPISNGVYLVSVSDQNIKHDIQTDTLGLDFISQLQPKTYRLNSDPLLKYHGFIAQDVHAISELSNDDSLKILHQDGMLGVDYVSLIAPLVNSIKELKAQNDALMSRIEVLESR